MDNADVTRYIVAQLRKYRNPNDVIEEVCEKTGMKWADAQEFVRRVQDEHVAEISGGQNTLLIGIRVAMVIGGAALSLVSFLLTFGGWALLPILPIPYLGNAIFFAIGIALTIGGVRELWNMEKQKK